MCSQLSETAAPLSLEHATFARQTGIAGQLLDLDPLVFEFGGEVGRHL